MADDEQAKHSQVAGSRPTTESTRQAAPQSRKTAICLLGPTAVGKTDLAVDLVSRFPLEIVSVDSAMVYRGLDIGSGKPSAQLLSRAPHWLIDIRDPRQPYSAADFAGDALTAMENILTRAKLPLLVGGTFLYLRSLRDGLSNLPGANPQIRRGLDAQIERDGIGALHRRLRSVDRQAAERIQEGDTQRVVRALEVFEITGQPISFLQAQRHSLADDWNFVALSLQPSQRAWLHDRIAARFKLMLEAGLVDEVRGLIELEGVHDALPAMRAVGYRQVIDTLRGRAGSEDLAERGIAATRQLARRQLTWLRKERELLRLDVNQSHVEGRLRAHVDEVLQRSTGAN